MLLMTVISIITDTGKDNANYMIMVACVRNIVLVTLTIYQWVSRNIEETALRIKENMIISFSNIGMNFLRVFVPNVCAQSLYEDNHIHCRGWFRVIPPGNFVTLLVNMTDQPGPTERGP